MCFVHVGDGRFADFLNRLDWRREVQVFMVRELTEGFSDGSCEVYVVSPLTV